MGAEDSGLRRATFAFFGLALLLLPVTLEHYGASLGTVPLVLIAAAHHLCALVFGGALLGRAAPALRGTGERWLLGWALGLGLFGHVYLLVAHVGLFHPPLAALVPLLGVLGAALARDDLARAPSEIAAAVSGRWTPVWLGLVVVVIALTSAPPTFYDACSYHVAIPQQWLEHGHAVVSRHFVYSAIPLNAELSASPLLLATGDPAAVNLSSGLSFALLVLLAAATGKRFASAGGTVATVVATMPLVWFLAVGTKSDLHTSLHALALLFAVGLIVAPLPGQSARERAVLVGTFAGLMLATKTTALAHLPFVLLLLALVPTWRASLGGVRGLAIAAAIATAFGAPVWVQNAVLLGNPIFPALSSVFGGPPESAKVTAILDAWNTHVALGDVWRLPWDLTFSVRSGTMNNMPGVLLLLCAPIAFFTGPLPRGLRAMLLVALVTIPGWLLTQSLLRYDPLVWLALALLAGHVLERLLAGGSAARVVVAAVVVVATLASARWTLLSHEVLLRRPSEWLLRGVDRDAFLTQAIEPYAAYRFINEHLPADAVILPMSDARLLYLERRAVLSELQAQPVWEEPVRAAGEPGDIAARFVQLGATHLLFHGPSVARAQKLGWGTWDAPTTERFQAFLAGLGQPLFDEDGFRLFALPGAKRAKPSSD